MNAMVRDVPSARRRRLISEGIFQGSSTLLLGAAGGDGVSNSGLRITVHAGDVLVLPAGTGHSSVASEGDYRYIGVYPDVSAREWS